MTAAAGTCSPGNLPLPRAGPAPRLLQDHSQATYFGGRRPEDGKINWRQPATASIT